MSPINFDHVSRAQETRPCPFPVMGNGHGRVTELKDDKFSIRNLVRFPERNGFGHVIFLDFFPLDGRSFAA